MKICSVCRRCYEDDALTCAEKSHGSLAAARQGNCEMIAGYRLNYLLERDAAGETFEATRIASHSPFIVKFIAAGSVGNLRMARDRFFSETRAAADINHPNVARLFESGALENGEFYLVSEAGGGETLREYLRSVGSFSEIAAVTIARQAAEGLEAAHRAGVIHRAISPANIILADEQNHPTVKLQNFDFGGFRQEIEVSRITDGKPDIDALRYLSPEQCSGQAANARTDIYSLGVTLYEMLAGRSPFDKPTFDEIVHKQINEQPLEKLHFDIRALIKHALHLALQKSPAARPAAANFARHLRHIEQVASQMSFNASLPFLPGNKVESASRISGNSGALPENDLPVEESQPPIADSAKEDAAGNAFTNSLIAPPVETNDEKGAEIVAAPIFQSLPILIKRKQAAGAAEFDSQPIRLKKREAEAAPFAPELIRIKKKEPAAPAGDVISAPVQSIAEIQTEPMKPKPAKSFDIYGASRQPAPARRNLFTGIALAALLACVVLGALIYKGQLFQSSTSPAVASSSPTPAPLQPKESVNTGGDPADAKSHPETAGIEKTAPNDQLSPASSKRDDKIQLREQTSSVNPPAKQNAPLDEKPASGKSLTPAEISRSQPNDGAKDAAQSELNASLSKWISATNARDVDRQMSYYAPKVNAYYHARNASQDAVRAEKKRVFEKATAVDIQTGKPEINVSPDGRSATMRFHKKYAIKERERNRNGEVIQELQWVKSGSGWRIVSERDVKVINH